MLLKGGLFSQGHEYGGRHGHSGGSAQSASVTGGLRGDSRGLASLAGGLGSWVDGFYHCPLRGASPSLGGWHSGAACTGSLPC